jgi:hypothetical protein
MDDLNGTGGVIDYMGRNNGTPTDNGTINSQVDNGYFGKGWEFDGDGDYVDFGNDSNLGVYDFTFSAWVKPNSVSGDNVILAKHDSSVEGYIFEIDGTVLKIKWDDAASNYITGSTVLSTGSWYYVAATYDGTTGTLYLNGVNDTDTISSSYSGYPTTHIGNLYFGRLYSGGLWEFNGTIDDVMVFNRSLSAAEIVALYANQSTRYLETNFTSLPDASYNFKAYTQDRAGNVNFTETRTVTVDTTAPSITVVHPKNNSFWNTTTIEFNISLDSAGDTCKFSVNETANITMDSVSTTSFNYTYTNLINGTTYNITFWCNDSLSNTVHTPPYYFTIDTEFPDIVFDPTTTATGTQSDDWVFINVTAWDTGSNITTFIDWNNSLVSWWRMDDTNTTHVIDYLGRNNGTIVNAWRDVDGYFGKSIEFNRNDWIDFGTEQSLRPDVFTISAWVQLDAFTDNLFVGWGAGTDVRPAIHFDRGGSGEPAIVLGAGNYRYFAASAYTTLIDGDWHHVVFTVPGAAQSDITNSAMYLDGISQAIGGGGTLSSGGQNAKDIFRIARQYVYYGDGRFDDVMIFNRSLTAAEIIALYANQSTRYLETNFTSLPNWNYTFKAYTQDRAGNVNSTEERWSQTGNDPPNQPNLISPNGTIFDRYQSFNWTATDPNGDALTYYLNITCFGPDCVSGTDNYFITGITDSNYTLQTPLKRFWDDNNYYNWSVRANDGMFNSTWSNISNFSLQSVVALSLSQAELYFGTMNPGDTDDTSDDSPVPYNLSNDGNCMNDVNISATDLWLSVSSPTDYYRFKADNVSSVATDLNVNWSNSTYTWTQLPITTTKFLDYFNWSNRTITADTIELDIAVEVPSDEAAGNRSSTITITGMYVKEA